MTAVQQMSRRRTIGLMVGLMMGVLLTLMDQTVVSTALPTIAGRLGGLNLYAWVFSAYLLAQTSFLPIFGKLSDIYGRRRMFLIGVGAFMLGSALCGQARTMEQLIIFRGLQGIGGAGLMPTALAILGVNYAPQQRARLQGILGSSAALAVIVGPTVGSLIVENLSWRWVFYINLPLGVLSALLVTIFLRESRDAKGSVAIDYAGALTLMGWVASLMLAFFFRRDHPWSSPLVAGLLAACVALFSLFIINERRAKEPILPLRIFSHRTVAAAGSVAFIRAIAMYSLIIYIPLLVQGVLGETSASARNVLTVFALPGILGAVAAGFMVGRGVGYRTMTIAALAVSGLGLWLVRGIGIGSTSGGLLFDVALAGLGVGMTQVTIILAIQNSVSQEYMGTASSLSQFLTNLAGTVGVGLLGTYQANLLAKGVRPVLASPAFKELPAELAQLLRDPSYLAQVLTNPAVAAKLPGEMVTTIRLALENSLHSVFLIGFVLTAVAIVFGLFIRGSAASAALRGGRRPLLSLVRRRHDDP